MANDKKMAQFAQRAAEEETSGIYYEQVTAWFCDESGNISLITRFCDSVRHELGDPHVIATPRSLGRLRKPLNCSL
jgi:hypothetical protein